MTYLSIADERALQGSIETLEKVLELYDRLEMDFAAAHIAAGLNSALEARKAALPNDMTGAAGTLLTFRR